MKITSSDLTLSSSRYYSEIHEKSESLKVWSKGKEASSNPNGTILQISEEARQALRESMTSVSTMRVNTEYDIDNELPDKETLKIQLLEAFLKSLTGKKIKFKRPEKINLNPSQNLNVAQPIGVGWGIVYDYKELHYESEKVSFNAAGIVKTADGKEISIDLSISMSREFMSYNEIQFRAGDALLVDPLVINFSGSSVALTERKFSFDLDCDGTLDQISFLGEGSGFLALDLNNDGKINDGSELFGPKSGDGFRDLSAYDEDKNGWIDENDPIFERLRIWTKDAQGNDRLFALGQKGIGAIYLGNVLTDFSLNNSSNETQGKIRKTGIFLNENGTVGTIQHVDMAL